MATLTMAQRRAALAERNAVNAQARAATRASLNRPLTLRQQNLQRIGTTPVPQQMNPQQQWEAQLQGIPEYTQMVQLQNSLQGRQPTPDELVQLDYLKQKLTSNPAFQGAQQKMAQLQPSPAQQMQGAADPAKANLQNNGRASYGVMTPEQRAPYDAAKLARANGQTSAAMPIGQTNTNSGAVIGQLAKPAPVASQPPSTLPANPVAPNRQPSNSAALAANMQQNMNQVQGAQSLPKAPQGFGLTRNQYTGDGP